MRTDHTQFPISMTPSAAARASKRGQTIAAMAAVKTLAEVLGAHPDPVVTASIATLTELCIQPWIDMQVKVVEGGIVINDDEHYDLVLPPIPAEGERGARVLFGSGPNSAVCLGATEDTVGAVEGKRDEEGTYWKLEVFLDSPSSTMHLNGEELEVERRARHHHRSSDSNCFRVEAGDQIRVGHHVIHVVEEAK